MPGVTMPIYDIPKHIMPRTNQRVFLNLFM
jgi:hypothetical protein